MGQIIAVVGAASIGLIVWNVGLDAKDKREISEDIGIFLFDLLLSGSHDKEIDEAIKLEGEGALIIQKQLIDKVKNGDLTEDQKTKLREFAGNKLVEKAKPEVFYSARVIDALTSDLNLLSDARKIDSLLVDIDKLPDQRHTVTKWERLYPYFKRVCIQKCVSGCSRV